MVVNYLDINGGTHGWHLDDPDYALIIIIDAPKEVNGGNIEYIQNWESFCDFHNVDINKVKEGVKLARKTGKVSIAHHRKGDCYLLNAKQNLHRVTELHNTSKARKALNIAYGRHMNIDYGQTANLLYA